MGRVACRSLIPGPAWRGRDIRVAPEPRAGARVRGPFPARRILGGPVRLLCSVLLLFTQERSCLNLHQDRRSAVSERRAPNGGRSSESRRSAARAARARGAPSASPRMEGAVTHRAPISHPVVHATGGGGGRGGLGAGRGCGSGARAWRVKRGTDILRPPVFNRGGEWQRRQTTMPAAGATQHHCTCTAQDIRGSDCAERQRSSAWCRLHGMRSTGGRRRCV